MVTGQPWWGRAAAHLCQPPSQAEPTWSRSCSALIAMVQSLALVSAGLQWHQVSVNMHNLKCLDNIFLLLQIIVNSALRILDFPPILFLYLWFKHFFFISSLAEKCLDNIFLLLQTSLSENWIFHRFCLSFSDSNISFSFHPWPPFSLVIDCTQGQRAKEGGTTWIDEGLRINGLEMFLLCHAIVFF